MPPAGTSNTLCAAHLVPVCAGLVGAPCSTWSLIVTFGYGPSLSFSQNSHVTVGS